MDGEIKSGEIYTGFLKLSKGAYESGSSHPGVLVIGDVNGDGRLDDEDKNAIISNIDKEGGQGGTDLNGDGKTTLMDLQHFADSLERRKRGADTQAVLTSRLSKESVVVNLNQEGGTALKDGNPEELLSGNKTVTFSRNDGEEISDENPVEFGFNLVPDEKQEDG